MLVQFKRVCDVFIPPDSGCNAELGGFAGLFDLKAAGFVDPLLVAGTDGVGTKLKVMPVDLPLVVFKICQVKYLSIDEA